MSSSVDTDGEVTVSDDGITVRKRYAPEEFPVPAIRFEIESDHDGPVTVRLTESIPESFPMDAVGFHPDYHSDQWTAFQDNRVRFTGTVEADTSLVTVYGIRLEDELDSTAFLTEPSISVEDAETAAESTASDVSESVEDVVSTERDEVVKDMLSGDRESVPGLESEESTAESSESDSVDDSEPDIELDIDAAAERVADETSDTADQSSESDRTADAEEASAETGPSGSDVTADEAGETRSVFDENELPNASADTDLVSALAGALRSESFDETDVRTIRDALGTASSGSTEAKLSHLQERVEEVAAYTGALEEFLDEEGTGAQVIADVRTELESLRAQLSTVTETVETNTDRLDDLDTTVTDQSESIESVSSSVSAVEDSVTTVKTSLDEQGETIDSVTDHVETLEGTVDDLEGRTSDLEGNVEGNTAELDSLSETVDTIETDLESVSDDVVDILEWREQLGSMFTED